MFTRRNITARRARRLGMTAMECAFLLSAAVLAVAGLVGLSNSMRATFEYVAEAPEDEKGNNGNRYGHYK